MTASFALFGDSIANGMGSQGKSYGWIVSSQLHWKFYDFTGSALPVTESLGLLKASTISPDTAIIAHGITEAIPRPKPQILRFVPKRWRRTGWMDARPYFSRSRHKRIIQKTESGIRWRLRNVLIRLGGAHVMLSLADYEAALIELVDELQARGSRVILIGPPDIDERFFPGAQSSEKLYAQVGLNLGIEAISLSGILDFGSDYLADGFHPNEQGHQKIARLILTRLRETQ